MRIKIDENLPLRLAFMLKMSGHDVHTVEEEGIGGGPDHLVWEMAQREARFLITQDLDFSDVRRFAPGTHRGILVVRLHSPSRLALIKRIEEVFRAEDVNRWVGCFVVATDRKVRVRRPKPEISA